MSEIPCHAIRKRMELGYQKPTLATASSQVKGLLFRYTLRNKHQGISPGVNVVGRDSTASRSKSIR